ncbi:hypothetical protein BKA65DRAFT_252749 [Rhexocercosporidium sp. MPI-PUGE-AT-0058]|nr:hypothetical protein BKA65DRAFT_252749 [Rhexocercosporidium sp. MPI-PUGE-AT-0058]
MCYRYTFAVLHLAVASGEGNLCGCCLYLMPLSASSVSVTSCSILYLARTSKAPRAKFSVRGGRLSLSERKMAKCSMWQMSTIPKRPCQYQASACS